MFSTLHEPINQGIRQLKSRPEKTINMASVSSQIDLKNRFSDFCHMRLLFFFFYKRIKLEKGKNKTAREKERHNNQNLQTRFCLQTFGQRSLRISTNLSRGCRLGTRNARKLACFLLSRNREKIKFGGIQVL